MTQLVKTTQPDFRFTNFTDWRNFIIRQSFEAQNKVTAIKVNELIFKRLNVTA